MERFKTLAKDNVLAPKMDSIRGLSLFERLMHTVSTALSVTATEELY
jgi:hypothetical protein